MVNSWKISWIRTISYYIDKQVSNEGVFILNKENSRTDVFAF